MCETDLFPSLSEDSMRQRIQFFIGFTTMLAAIHLPLLPQASAQLSEQVSEQELRVGQVPSGTSPRPPAQTNFQGRGVAQGSAFTRGRNATVNLIIERDNFGFELTEPGGRTEAGPRAQVQYRGAVIRKTNVSTNSNSFTLDGRIRSFSSSANLRVLPNTTGTCRIEVFDARVISSTCRTATADSTTQFLGLEQF
jgi:hypothetical protein